MQLDYNRLRKKEIVLCETGKFQEDIEEFFDELNIIGYIVTNSNNAPAFSGKGKEVYSLYTLQRSAWEGRMIVVCSFQPDGIGRTLDGLGLVYGRDYIHGIDLIAVIDETETYNVGRNYPNRKVVVMGTGDNCAKLLLRNPHLTVAYFIDNDPGKHGDIFYNRQIRPAAAILDEPRGSYVIIATPSDIQSIKKQLEDMALVFGEDFYCYNSTRFPYARIADVRDSFEYYLAVNNIQRDTPLPVAVYGLNARAERFFDENNPIDIKCIAVADKSKFGASYAGKAIVSLSEVRGFLGDGGILLNLDDERELKKSSSINPSWKIFDLSVDPSWRSEPSEMLVKTIACKLTYELECALSARMLRIDENGMGHWCSGRLRMQSGRNILQDDLRNIVKMPQARIAHLSLSNKTFVFCAKTCSTLKNIASGGILEKRTKTGLPGLGDYTIGLSYDPSCNLACGSCRDHYIPSPENKELSDVIHAEISRSMKYFKRSVLNVNGELFFSRYYRDLFFNVNPSRKLSFYTNGLLFNQGNYDALKKKYEYLHARFSVDAASEAVYAKIRGGDWGLLLKNLRFASQLRKSDGLQKFGISFVVQKDNFRDMPEFVKLGDELGVDYLLFAGIDNWGTCDPEKFSDINVFNKNNPHYEECQSILSSPLFLQPWIILSFRSNA